MELDSRQKFALFKAHNAANGAFQRRPFAPCLVFSIAKMTNCAFPKVSTMSQYTSVQWNAKQRSASVANRDGFETTYNCRKDNCCKATKAEILVLIGKQKLRLLAHWIPSKIWSDIIMIIEVRCSYFAASNSSAEDSGGPRDLAALNSCNSRLNLCSKISSVDLPWFQPSSLHSLHFDSTELCPKDCLSYLYFISTIQYYL